jgi:hypothetical protein
MPTKHVQACASQSKFIRLVACRQAAPRTCKACQSNAPGCASCAAILFWLLSKHAPRNPPIDKWLTNKNRGRRKGFRLDVRLLPSWLAASTNRSMVCCAVGPRIHIHASISPKNLACCLSLPSSFQHATGVLSSLLKYSMVVLKGTTEGVTTGWLTMTDRPVGLAGSAMLSAILVGLVWFGVVWFGLAGSAKHFVCDSSFCLG